MNDKKEFHNTLLAAPERTDADIIQSASVTALFRALLSEERAFKKNPDYLAKYFVNDNWIEFLKNPEASRKALEERLPGGIYYHLVRTKYFDQSLLKWLIKHPASQIVFLGTGFDTRTIRFEKELNSAKIFEVDLKAMLDYKKTVIKKNSLEKNPLNKTYVPINFHKENILEKLKNSGLNIKIPTYFLIEGVTFFLEKSTVENIFNDLFQEMKVPILIAFDYVFEDYINGDYSYHGATQMNNELSQIGEPHIFGIDYENIDTFVENMGYSSQNNFTALMLESLYLTTKRGDSVGRPHSFFGLTEAIN